MKSGYGPMHAWGAALALALQVPCSAVANAEAAAPEVQGFMVGPALYVSDYKRSQAFYVDGLGMKVRLRFGPPDHPDMVVGFGTDPAQPGIMLLTDKTGKPQPIKHVHGFDRIAFRIPNLTAVAARLNQAGFPTPPIEVAHGSIQVLMVTDPDGYRLELIDTMPAQKGK